MSRGVLLDTNLLIKALDKKSGTSPEDRRAAKQQLSELLSDSSVDVAITPLIRYEFLRHVEFADSERYKALEDVISGIFLLQISVEVSELATRLFQFDTFEAAEANVEKNIDKRKFDTFHLAAAKCNDYEMASDDSDIAKLESLYERYIKASRDQAKDNNTNPNNEENT